MDRCLHHKTTIITAVAAGFQKGGPGLKCKWRFQRWGLESREMKLFASVEVFLGMYVHFSFLSCQLACKMLSVIIVRNAFSHLHREALCLPCFYPVKWWSRKNQWEVCIKGIKFRPHKWSLTSLVCLGKASRNRGLEEPSGSLIPTSCYCRLSLCIILWKSWLIFKNVDNHRKPHNLSI